MPKGLNTEIDPSKLPANSFQAFRQATIRGGVLKARPGDAAYTPAGSSIEEWLLGKIGTNDVARVYSADAEAEYYAYAAKAGGTPKIYDHATTTEQDLALSTPDEPTPYNYAMISALTPTAGIANGDTAKYGATWQDDFSEYRGNLSDIVSVTNDYIFIPTTDTTAGSPPGWTYGETITNNTQGDTAPLRGWSTLVTLTPSYKVGFVIRDDEKTSGATWTAGDSITVNGVSYTVGAMSGLPGVEGTGDITPQFSQGASFPTGITDWELYRLDSSGYYRAVGVDVAGGYKADTSRFPYLDAAQTEIAPLWNGPLDAQYLPETLVSSLSGANVHEVHKGCLVVTVGNIIRFSEPEQPRYFRDRFSLDAGDTVLKVVSRDEVAEVYTPTSVKYIVGNAPYFEIREIGLTEGPVSRESITKTDVGTYALFDDGLYLVTGTTRRNITEGNNTPYINGLVSASGTVGGASKGIYYLVDTDGDCLAYDWEQDEFFEKVFTTQPDAFLFLDDARALVSATGASYASIGLGTSAVPWLATWPDSGDGRLRAIPARIYIDAEGDCTFNLLVDGVNKQGFPVEEPREYAMGIFRGRFYTVKLSGTNTPSNNEVRRVEWR